MSKVAKLNLVGASLMLLSLQFPSAFAQESSICIIKGAPPSEYQYHTIKKLVIGKGSYGGIETIQPRFARLAKEAGAEAVIYYHARQRFGFWPWRIVRPVITGTAIRWEKENEKNFSCKENGGFYL